MRPGSRSILIAALVVSADARSAAADAIEQGRVVWIEAGEAFFDIGTSAGLAPGDPIRVRRPITLHHPVTGKPVTDELPLGSLQVLAVGHELSKAQLGDLVGAVAVGDVVDVLVKRREPDAPRPQVKPRPAPPPEPPLPAVNDATAAVLDTFRQTIGQRLDVRIAAWEQFLETNPESPYADSVRADLTELRAYREKFPTPLAEDEPVVDGLAHDPPRRAYPGEPLQLALVDDRGDLLAAWVHYRAMGDDTFRRVNLRRDGDGYLRAPLPADVVGAPGLEYFVEIAEQSGTVGTAVGTPSEPIPVTVELPPTARVFAERRGRSQMSLRTTYLDFATFDKRDGDRRDTFFLFEADFFYRLRASWLYGIRTGFGVINGRGGYADGTEPAKAGFNYGYTELEVRRRENVAYLARLVAGLGREGLGFGIEGRLRLGPEDDTNLTFAVSSLEEVGFLSEIRMQWAAVRQFPLGFAVALTDQPNQGDLGVRLSMDAGWRALDWFQPTVRVSYQGRTVEHSGVGAGLGLVFDW